MQHVVRGFSMSSWFWGKGSLYYPRPSILAPILGILVFIDKRKAAFRLPLTGVIGL